MSQRRQKLSARHVFIASSVILFTLLTIITICYRSIKDVQESTNWVKHTLSVIAEIERIENDISGLGAIQRGYLLTGQERYISLYESTLPSLMSQIDKVKKLTYDNSFQQQQIKKLSVVTNELHDVYQINLDLVKAGNTAEAIERVKAGLGQNKIENALAILKDMAHHEEELLDMRIREQKSATTTSNYILLVGTLVAILMIMLLSYLVISEFNRRAKVQAELDKASQIQKAILDSAAFAIIAGDRDGKTTLFNPAAEKLLGYKASEVIGQTPEKFHVPEEVIDMAENLSARFGEVIAPGYDAFVYRARKNIVEADHWTYIRKDGTKIPVSLSVTAQRDSNGDITGYVGIAHDISEQLQHENILIKAREQALAGTKAKSEFLANMSHEIRTPMNAIMGMAELLEETNLDDEQRRYVDTFQRAGESLLNLINDILDLSKIEAGHFELDYVPFNISDVVDKTSEIVATKAHQKNLELIVDIDENMHESYIGDPNRLRQVFLNLLGNSIKFTKQGEILLKIGKLPDRDGLSGIYFQVKDSGIGMSPEQLKHLFERFKQADSSITKEYGGTGLGLNITKRLVELMNGKVEVESTFNEGTTFTVHIYLKKDENPVESEKINLKGKRILVVDDNKTNRFIFTKILSHYEAMVEDVDGGLEALEIIKKSAAENKPYDLILLDGRMPGLDGFSVAEKVQGSDELKGPIIMMITSDNRPGDLARARALGLKSYLLKPILKNELLTQIKKCLFNDSEDKKAVETVVKPTTESNLYILLVDDNDENRLVIRSFVKNLKWTVDEAKNGQEALDLASKNKYDLILMDMQMPIMDGYTATREIRRIEKENLTSPIPILALTAYALKEEVDKSLNAGCNGHISKPISKSKLIQSVEEYSAELKVIVDKDLEDLIPDYLKNRGKEVDDIEAAFLQNDFAKVQALGHKLRGSAGSYGFNFLSEIGKELEEKSKVSDQTSIRHAINQYRLYLKRVKVSYT